MMRVICPSPVDKRGEEKARPTPNNSEVRHDLTKVDDTEQIDRQGCCLAFRAGGELRRRRLGSRKSAVAYLKRRASSHFPKSFFEASTVMLIRLRGGNHNFVGLEGEPTSEVWSENTLRHSC